MQSQQYANYNVQSNSQRCINYHCHDNHDHQSRQNFSNDRLYYENLNSSLNQFILKISKATELYQASYHIFITWCKAFREYYHKSHELLTQTSKSINNTLHTNNQNRYFTSMSILYIDTMMTICSHSTHEIDNTLSELNIKNMKITNKIKTYEEVNVNVMKKWIIENENMNKMNENYKQPFDEIKMNGNNDYIEGNISDCHHYQYQHQSHHPRNYYDVKVNQSKQGQQSQQQESKTPFGFYENDQQNQGELLKKPKIHTMISHSKDMYSQILQCLIEMYMRFISMIESISKYTIDKYTNSLPYMKNYKESDIMNTPNYKLDDVKSKNKNNKDSETNPKNIKLSNNEATIQKTNENLCTPQQFHNFLNEYLDKTLKTYEKSHIDIDNLIKYWEGYSIKCENFVNNTNKTTQLHNLINLSKDCYNDKLTNILTNLSDLLTKIALDYRQYAKQISCLNQKYLISIGQAKYQAYLLLHDSINKLLINLQIQVNQLNNNESQNGMIEFQSTNNTNNSPLTTPTSLYDICNNNNNNQHKDIDNKLHVEEIMKTRNKIENLVKEYILINYTQDKCAIESIDTLITFFKNIHIKRTTITSSFINRLNNDFPQDSITTMINNMLLEDNHLKLIVNLVNIHHDSLTNHSSKSLNICHTEPTHENYWLESTNSPIKLHKINSNIDFTPENIDDNDHDHELEYELKKKRISELDNNLAFSPKKPRSKKNQLPKWHFSPTKTTISQELKTKLFIQTNEQIFTDVSCSLLDKILIQGRLYLTSLKLAFHSYFNNETSFGDTRLIIPLNDIINIEKKENGIYGFENVIQIKTVNASIVFTSFLERDNIYQAIQLMLLNYSTSYSNVELDEYIPYSAGQPNTLGNSTILNSPVKLKSYTYDIGLFDDIPNEENCKRQRTFSRVRNDLLIKRKQKILAKMPSLQEFTLKGLTYTIKNTTLYKVFDVLFNENSLNIKDKAYNSWWEAYILALYQDYPPFSTHWSNELPKSFTNDDLLAFGSESIIRKTRGTMISKKGPIQYEQTQNLYILDNKEIILHMNTNALTHLQLKDVFLLPKILIIKQHENQDVIIEEYYMHESSMSHNIELAMKEIEDIASKMRGLLEDLNCEEKFCVLEGIKPIVNNAITIKADNAIPIKSDDKPISKKIDKPSKQKIKLKPKINFAEIKIKQRKDIENRKQRVITKMPKLTDYKTSGFINHVHNTTLYKFFDTVFCQDNMIINGKKYNSWWEYFMLLVYSKKPVKVSPWSISPPKSFRYKDLMNIGDEPLVRKVYGTKPLKDIPFVNSLDYDETQILFILDDKQLVLENQVKILSSIPLRDTFIYKNIYVIQEDTNGIVSMELRYTLEFVKSTIFKSKIQKSTLEEIADTGRMVKKSLEDFYMSGKFALNDNEEKEFYETINEDMNNSMHNDENRNDNDDNDGRGDDDGYSSKNLNNSSIRHEIQANAKNSALMIPNKNK